ncbi:MAG: lipopolysaccharide kinase InaA family protein [Candidatus Brocadia sp.]|nr:lipopolysaccharide kinase InaA family protein [Candidatus Brocadia sp.]
MQFLRHILCFITSPFSISDTSAFKGYISKTFGQVHWIIHNHHAFLAPCLEQMKESTRDTLLANPLFRRHRYKKMGKWEIAHENKKEAYLIKIYNYPRLLQKIKQLFKDSRGFHEFSTTYLTAMRGIPVEVPVAYGERKRMFTKESYLIIREIKDSHSLREYFRSDALLEERRDILRKFGKLAKNVHESGIQQDAFSLDNFLVYRDEAGSIKIIVIDFEMVSIRTSGLKEKRCVWYLAKLNREKGNFTNTDRMRFILSYAGGNFVQCKRLAKRIEALTVWIQKKDAKKASRLCLHENRTFGIFKSDKFLGYYRKKYDLETLETLLNTIGETDRDVFHINHFRIFRFMDHSTTGLNYSAITQSWIHANALLALKINVPIPVGIFKRCFPNIQREGFLVSEMPDNCIPLKQRPELYADKNLLFILLGLAEQVSPFGVFSKDLNPHDILVQTKEDRQFKCYLGNDTSFRLNRLPVHKNRQVNTHIIKQLLRT